MAEVNIASVLEKAMEELIAENIDKEIVKRTEDFHRELVSRKDQYIAEVMKGIRIVHERNPENLCFDYRIMFVNKYER